MSIHPWNATLWQQLIQNRARIPHALLLHGPNGVGKGVLARELAQWLLCESPTPDGGCGRCASCSWLAQGHHPDLRVVEPAEDTDAASDKPKRSRQLITVENVRQLLEFLSLTAHQGGWRVVILNPAEAMNTAASNALLKTLEEPPANVVLILVSHQPRRLLPTVLSRCRKIAVPLPDGGLAMTWLESTGVPQAEALLREAGGAPLLALEYGAEERLSRRDQFLQALSDPRAQDWSEWAQTLQVHLAESWGWFARWMHDLARCQAGVGARYFPAYHAILQGLAERAQPVRVWQLHRDVLAAGRVLNHPLNGQLLLESLLLQYATLREEA